MEQNFLNKIIINLKNIEYNLERIKEHTKGTKILLPVKADAYGHGIEEVVKYFKNSPLVDYFGVANIMEASIIRKLNIEKPILLLGTPTKEELEMCIILNVNPTISTLENHEFYNQLVISYGKYIPEAHIKVDTGMHRHGLYPEQVLEVIKTAKYKIGGVYTHFATADDYDMTFFLNQKGEFYSIVSEIKDMGKDDIIFHCANSAALLKDETTFFDMVRPGISSYGYYPSEMFREFIELKPALSLETTLIGIKEIKRGDYVSYGLTWQAEDDTYIGILPIGYGDGIFRILTNKWKVLIRDTIVPIIGTVCMDQIIINLNGIEDKVKVGDKVKIIDGEYDWSLSVENMAKQALTIPYEITTHLKDIRSEKIYIK